MFVCAGRFYNIFFILKFLSCTSARVRLRVRFAASVWRSRRHSSFLLVYSRQTPHSAHTHTQYKRSALQILLMYVFEERQSSATLFSHAELTHECECNCAFVRGKPYSRLHLHTIHSITLVFGQAWFDTVPKQLNLIRHICLLLLESGNVQLPNTAGRVHRISAKYVFGGNATRTHAGDAVVTLGVSITQRIYRPHAYVCSRRFHRIFICCEPPLIPRFWE